MPDTTKQMTERPIEELKAGNAFRDSLVSRADFDDRGVPYWCGWALMDAFLAGIDYARAQQSHTRAALEEARVALADAIYLFDHPRQGEDEALCIRAMKAAGRAIQAALNPDGVVRL